MEGMREKYENEGFLWRNKGVKKMGLVFEWRGKKGFFAVVFSHEINGISEYRMGTVVKIWIEA